MRQFKTMVAMLEEMGEQCLLTMETFSIAICAFATSNERKKGVGILDLLKKHKYKVGAETINCLLNALGRVKLGKEANALLEKFKERLNKEERWRIERKS
ncbi:hypothetical protein CDL15_Pgr026390 [Punica granatum]|uniref:Pentatricopeptide repeat-containing protein n=1 Tax=Punica granatum TaxID=22663 RepID=A0A218XP00_PUNGR|nr:hypothetical protein CDL15_Pgr026390 [Punica granatum]PKI75049.1 hypothetical protein CRG98_004523 [Punica granatum]